MQCAMIFIGGRIFAWHVGRLGATSLSTTESEWFAQTLGATVLKIALPVMEFLDIPIRKPIISFCDNAGAVIISENNGSTKRLKHVATRMAYLQEQCDEGTLTIVHIGRDGMIADIGTKILPPDAFHRILPMLIHE